MVGSGSPGSGGCEEGGLSPVRCKASAEAKSRGASGEPTRANAVLRVGPWLSKPGDEYSRFPSSKPELIFTCRGAQPRAAESNTLTVAVDIEMTSEKESIWRPPKIEWHDFQIR